MISLHPGRWQKVALLPSSHAWCLQLWVRQSSLSWSVFFTYCFYRVRFFEHLWNQQTFLFEFTGLLCPWQAVAECSPCEQQAAVVTTWSTRLWMSPHSHPRALDSSHVPWSVLLCCGVFVNGLCVPLWSTYELQGLPWSSWTQKWTQIWTFPLFCLKCQASMYHC